MHRRMVAAAVSMMLAVPALAAEGTESVVVETPAPLQVHARAQEPDGNPTWYLVGGGLIGAGVGAGAWMMLGGIGACLASPLWCSYSLPVLGLFSVVGAGVGLVGGGLWYSVWHEPPRRLALLPVIGPRGEGLTLVGSF